jgi:hypothetical protein
MVETERRTPEIATLTKDQMCQTIYQVSMCIVPSAILLSRNKASIKKPIDTIAGTMFITSVEYCNQLFYQ